ncbi:proline-rich protein HaeIII subfamily 1-like [Budorcas taxicolor]|uniref:proline-rich protein HaeIII subfamily 1-like n=1 Tax=Budorcas taxicolor TaxID=37181 RepID=UPI002283825E|nr:proline-rich protein HaeIII subfamily 1-like [Budorcas taxicolor]
MPHPHKVSTQQAHSFRKKRHVQQHCPALQEGRRPGPAGNLGPDKPKGSCWSNLKGSSRPRGPGFFLGRLPSFTKRTAQEAPGLPVGRGARLSPRLGLGVPAPRGPEALRLHSAAWSQVHTLPETADLGVRVPEPCGGPPPSPGRCPRGPSPETRPPSLRQPGVPPAPTPEAPSSGRSPRPRSEPPPQVGAPAPGRSPRPRSEPQLQSRRPKLQPPQLGPEPPPSWEPASREDPARGP